MYARPAAAAQMQTWPKNITTPLSLLSKYIPPALGLQ